MEDYMDSIELADDFDEYFHAGFWASIGLDDIKNTDAKYTPCIAIDDPAKFAYNFIHQKHNAHHAVGFFAGSFYKDFFDTPCVYFLYKHTPEQLIDMNKLEESPRPVYIGMTKSLLQRIIEHRHGKVKDFDSFGFVFTKTIEDAEKLETILIWLLNPKYNIRKADGALLAAQDMGMTTSAFQSLYRQSPSSSAP